MGCACRLNEALYSSVATAARCRIWAVAGLLVFAPPHRCLCQAPPPVPVVPLPGTPVVPAPEPPGPPEPGTPDGVPMLPGAFGVSSMFDARWVYDLVAVSRGLASNPEKTRLALFEVTPDQRSGREEFEGSFNPKTQTLDTHVLFLPLDFGSLRLVGSLGIPPRWRRGTFRWDWAIYLPEVGRFDWLVGGTNPFLAGGIAAIPPPDKLPLLQHPDPTYSIAPGYVGVLQDELAFCRAHPSWTEGLGTEARLVFAKEQMKSGNPLVMMEATRALAAAGKLDRETAAQLVRQGPEIRQAREVAAILCGMTKEEEATLGQVILDAIDGVKSSEDLKGLFLGSIVAYTVVWDQQESRIQFHASSGSVWGPQPLAGTAPFIQGVYKHVVDSQRAIRGHSAADRYLESLEHENSWAYKQAVHPGDSWSFDMEPLNPGTPPK